MNYIQVGNVKVDPKIFGAKFCCDYDKCKGACCSQPIQDVELNGGVLTDREAAEILYQRTSLSFLCDERDRGVAYQRPVNKDGGYFYTTLREEKCVFCSLEKGTCVLKLAHEKEVADIDIPLSCSLYPLVWEQHSGYSTLEIGDLFDKDYCMHGYIKGKREGVFLLDFLRKPLIRAFGLPFYDLLKREQDNFLNFLHKI